MLCSLSSRVEQAEQSLEPNMHRPRATMGTLGMGMLGLLPMVDILIHTMIIIVSSSHPVAMCQTHKIAFIQSIRGQGITDQDREARTVIPVTLAPAEKRSTMDQHTSAPVDFPVVRASTEVNERID